MEQVKISLIIPFFNDQERLVDRLSIVQEFFMKQKYSSEVILVDDNSTEDKTEEIRSKFPFVKIIRYSRNRGKGYAVRTGMHEACGDYCFFTDSDLPFGLGPINIGLKYLELKEFDLVIGDRHVPGSHFYVRQTFLRRMASKIFSSFISRIVVTGVKDTQCEF